MHAFGGLRPAAKAAPLPGRGLPPHPLRGQARMHLYSFLRNPAPLSRWRRKKRRWLATGAKPACRAVVFGGGGGCFGGGGDEGGWGVSLAAAQTLGVSEGWWFKNKGIFVTETKIN